ncbi:aminopeptidase [Chloroflexota bacterium]
MLKRLRNIDLIVKTCMEVKPNQQVLVVADDGARSTRIGQQVAEGCSSEGAEVVMSIMAPRAFNGQEPPRSIAEAMQAVDIIVIACEGFGIGHTNAAKAAREKGIKFVVCQSERHMNADISVDDLKKIKERSDDIVKIVSRSDTAQITTLDGTKLKMSLKGRKGIPLYPLSGAPITVVPEYAEVAVAPVEGSTEGTLVTDVGVRGWNLSLREPLRLTVKDGRVTEVSGAEDYVARFKSLLATDENAPNCAAELGFGTSHTMARHLVASGSLTGTIHIAVGRNNDIGGQTFSQIHNDLIISKPTVWLDDQCIVEDGELKI